MQMKPIKKRPEPQKLPSGRIFDEISRLLPQQGISGADHANGAKSACSPFSRRSAPPFLAFRCDLGVSYILLTGDRGFESISLQRGVRCEPDTPCPWRASRCDRRPNSSLCAAASGGDDGDLASL